MQGVRTSPGGERFRSPETARRHDDAARGGLVHDLVAERAALSPEFEAVVAGPERLTYGELNERANRLANLLQDRDATPDAVVGVYLPRGRELVVALLATLKAGAAYLPLDVSDPPARSAEMLRTAGAPLVLTSSELSGRLGEVATDVVTIDTVDVEELPAGDPASIATPEDLAYVVFTSGSTGRPKPVAVSHRALANHAAAIRARYGLDASDRVLQFANPAFDVFAEEVFPTLSAGGCVVVVPDPALTPADLQRFLGSAGVTVANLPTPYWTQWTRDLEREGGPPLPGSLRLLVVGTEKAPTATLARWWRHARVPVINAYGLSETTITVATRAFSPDEVPETETLPVGAPIDGCEALVCDEQLTPAAAGEPGELCVAGPALAEGYLGLPDLTAERFVAHPERPRERVLRTGDLARVDEHGEIEILGRVDRQVKVRGHRVEPSEIETTLSAHPDVAQAYVRAERDADRDETRLVGYVVPRDDKRIPSADALRAHVRARLPEYMAPVGYVVLHALPLGPNGKVDAAALPALDPLRGRTATPYAAPRTDTERWLADLWQELLFVERVGVDDDFFDLGGHSLTAMQIAGRVRSNLHVELSVPDVFASPTVRRLAETVEALRRERDRPLLPALEATPGETTAPLSFQQEQIWFHSKLAPESIAYQAQTTIRVVGPLDLEVLSRAVTEIARRHEILRTTYREVDGRPQQVVHPPEPVEIEEVDLSGLADGERETRLEELVREELRRPFDLSRLPLMRWTAIRLRPEEHELVLVEHHMVHDGSSFALLMRELTELYGAFARGEPSPLEELPVQYADYARWQRDALASEAMQGQRAAWSQRLGDLPPALELPTKGGRPAIQRFRGDTVRVDLPAGVPGALRAFCRDERVTPFMAMFAAFAALLHRYTGETDVSVASGFANRNVAETERLIGMFVNPVLLRCDVGGDPSFGAFVRHVREVVLEAARNQEFPFSELVRAVNPVRDATRNPLLHVMFSANDSPLPDIDLAGSSGTIFETANGSAKTDLNVVVIPRAQSRMADTGRIDDRVTMLWEYSEDAFEEATVRALVDAYLELLAGAVRAPDSRISELPLLRTEERNRILREWSRGRAEHADPPVHVAAAAVARRCAEAVAVRDGDRETTYAELDRRADALAARLEELGAGPETVVGVFLPRSTELVVAELGTPRAGAAYLPLEVDHPPGRLAFMCEDARAELVVTTEALRSRLPEAVRPVLMEELPSAAVARAPRPCEPGRLAYVMYTSGSTGRPKGVMIEHRALANFTGWFRQTLGVGADDRIALVNAPGFDGSVMDVWPALTAGASIVVADEDVRLSPPALQAWLLENGITLVFLTTPLAESLLTLEWPSETPLRCLLTGGDALKLRPDPALPFPLLNGYGPTEDTVFATTSFVEPAGEGRGRPEIGRPIDGTAAYVLGADLEPVPTGALGELYLGGAGVARGYLGRPALTAERFLPDRFGAEPGRRLYRTGDLVRHRPDGTIDFVGRSDTQVKLRGFRVEPGEIAVAIAEHPAIAEAHVAVREDAPGGGKRLVAYLVPRDGATAPSPADLRDHLEQELPSFMIPAAYAVLERIPLTANGKVDTAALPAPEAPSAAPADRAPSTQTESLVAEIWQEVLELPQVGVDQNFFDLGGHSLLLDQVRARLLDALGGQLPMVALFEHPTVRALAGYLDGRAVERPAEAAEPTVRRPEDAERRVERLRQRAARLAAARSDDERR